MAETITRKIELNQACVLVKGFKHHRFNRFTEKVVGQLHLTNCLVLLQRAYQVYQARVVQSARTEVKSLELGRRQNVAKELQNLVSKEIFAANQGLN